MDFDPMLLGIATFQILIFAYFIVSSEVLILRNPSTDKSAGDWGFGQVTSCLFVQPIPLTDIAKILALIVVIPSALAVVEAFLQVGFSRLHKRKIDQKLAKSKKHSMLTSHHPLFKF